MGGIFVATSNRAVLLIAVAALAVWGFSAHAQEIGTIGQGEGLAHAICAECHNVEKGAPPAARTSAPNFEALANTRGMTAMALRVALQTSHMRMPNLVLDEESRESVIKYILSLK